MATTILDTRCVCTFPHHMELPRPTDNHSGSYESPVMCQALEAHPEVEDYHDLMLWVPTEPYLSVLLVPSSL